MPSFIARSFVSIAVATLAMAAPSAAQSSVQFGTLAGPALTSITDLDKSADIGANMLKSKGRLGLQGGLFAMIPVKGALSLQPEVHYSQKGGKLETTVDLGEAQSTGDLAIGFRLAYVEIPVLVRLDLGSRGSWHPFITVGPAFSLRASCSVSLEAAGAGSISTDCDEGELGEEAGAAASSDPFAKTDIGGIAGVGLTGSLLGRSVFAQLRYNQGFSSIAKESVDNVSPRNRGFSVVFGLGF
ncbi:porin family protein [Gemmatimonas aurantiaca]|uniref:porin family protein n=1 Tax=Gemmatimonas aurantiaca TaxID=173480 RepID=UPI00301D2C5A